MFVRTGDRKAAARSIFEFADMMLGVELESELGDQVELSLEEVDMALDRKSVV